MARATAIAINALAGVVLLTGVAFGQDTGSITGTVKDQSGAALPGATVTVVSDALAVSQTVQTGAPGSSSSRSFRPAPIPSRRS